MGNLDGLFAPRSVALVGASDAPGSVGAVTLRNLRSGNFGGELLLVNPKHTVIDGLTVFPDVGHLPSVPDLAVIVTPPDQIARIAGDLGARGTKAAVVITAGFAECGPSGAELQREMLAAAAPFGLRILGPNCIGTISTPAGLNASFAQVMPPRGDIAFLSQSGAMVTTVLDWAAPRGIGFSHVMSFGDMADVDFGDVLEYLEHDAATRAIVLYVEGITRAQTFIAAARAVAKSKPLLALKAGRNPAGAKAARSHTGALAGADAVYDAAFRRIGMLRAADLTEFLAGIETLARTDPLRGERLAILTNGGGPGVLATDALIAAGGQLAEVSPATVTALDALLPPTWSHGNPVDMVGDAPARDFSVALDALRVDAGVDAVLVLNCPTAVTDPRDAARAVVDTVRANANAAGGRNVFTVWLGDDEAAPARTLFHEAGIATFATPEDAIAGFMQRIRYRRYAEAGVEMSTPAAIPFDRDAATVRDVLDRAIAARRQWLDADDVSRVFEAYAIPTLRCRAVPDADAAARAAVEIGSPVALKIRSADITHKSDAGGVVLDLISAERVRAAALEMLARIAVAQPGARIDGFLVQEMAALPAAAELIVGINADRVFGPVVLFGHGGTAVEAIGDTALELAPLDLTSARALIASTRVWRLLRGYRNSPPAAIDAIAGVLIRVAQLALDHPEIRELDINPLLANAEGVRAIDGRIAIGRDEP